MKPGVDVACTGVLPQATAVAYSVSATAATVASPRTISTSGISGAGLKKCMPRRGPGASCPAASAVIESDDVFDARMHSAPTTFSSAREELALRVEVLDDRLDDELRDAASGQRDDGRDPGDRGVGVAAAEPALGRPALPSASAMPLLRRVAGADARVVQLHAMAGQRGDLRDAGAHRAGADRRRRWSPSGARRQRVRAVASGR